MSFIQGVVTVPLNVKILAGAEKEEARKIEIRCSFLQSLAGKHRHPELNVENQATMFHAVLLGN